MIGIIRWRNTLFALLALLPLACGRAQGDQEGETPPPFVLTAREIQLARDLAEEPLGLVAEPSHPLQRICFVKIDLLPDSQAQTEQRLVMVHHYRYQGDATILTLVDLRKAEVVRVETLVHYPTALAEEELVRAERLARADARVRAMIDARPDAHLEARPLQITDMADSRFGHRLVRWHLRTSAGYVAGQSLLFDLTTETVTLDETLK